ncbi:MAG: TlpA family protein disulfide reductase, partial [Pseudomonadota bacterium]
MFVSSAAGVASPPDFALFDTKGQQHRLADYRGKWVVVNYWATWCPPCLDEIPELVEFHEKNAEGRAVVLGINYEDVDDLYLKTFVDEYFISYPVLLAEPGAANYFGRIRGLPTTFVISPAGEVVARRVGGVDAAYLERIIGAHTGPALSLSDSEVTVE